MVLIIYMNTLAINEKFFFVKIKFKYIYIFIFFVTLQLLFYKNNFIKINYSNFIPTTLYRSLNSVFIVFLIFYLLLALICVVKLVKFEFGPLIKRLYNLFNNFIQFVHSHISGFSLQYFYIIVRDNISIQIFDINNLVPCNYYFNDFRNFYIDNFFFN